MSQWKELCTSKICDSIPISPVEVCILAVSAVLLIIALTDVFTISFLLGDSMEPTIQNGSIAFVSGVDDVEEQDVVVYEHPKTGYLVGHRIISNEPEGYILKGDNNKQIDMVLVQESDIKGTVVYHINIPVDKELFWKIHPTH